MPVVTLERLREMKAQLHAIVSELTDEYYDKAIAESKKDRRILDIIHRSDIIFQALKPIVRERAGELDEDTAEVAYEILRTDADEFELVKALMHGYAARSLITDCWNCTLRPRADGSIQLNWRGVRTSPRRLVYVTLVEQIADDCMVIMDCGNKICVNPYHMVLSEKRATRHSSWSPTSRPGMTPSKAGDAGAAEKKKRRIERVRLSVQNALELTLESRRQDQLERDNNAIHDYTPATKANIEEYYNPYKHVVADQEAVEMGLPLDLKKRKKAIADLKAEQTSLEFGESVLPEKDAFGMPYSEEQIEASKLGEGHALEKAVDVQSVREALLGIIPRRSSGE